MYNLRNKLMHYTNDLSDGTDLKAEAIAAIESIVQYMDEDELLHHSRPLALAYLALTEEVDPLSIVHGRWIKDNSSFQTDDYYCCYFDYNCSECGEIVNDRHKLPKYCPNCKAKMDGDNVL